MRKYETLLLLSPELSGDNRREILENLTKVIEGQKGEVLLVDDWGKRDLAYPVYKQMRGHYIRLETGLPGPGVEELERIIRITDGIWKFVTVKLADEIESSEETAEAAPETVPEEVS